MPNKADPKTTDRASEPCCRRSKIDALRAALIDGERSGPSTEFDFDEFARSRRMRAAGPGTRT